MLLRNVEPNRFELYTPRHLRAPALVGIALMVGAALSVRYGTGPGQLVGAALLITAGVTLVVLGFPGGPRGFVSFGDAATLHKPTGVDVPLARARSIALVGGRRAVDGLERCLYGAELVLAGGQREPLLDHHEPAGVMRDLGLFLQRVALPVEGGWGLPLGAEPWVTPASAPSVEAQREPLVFDLPSAAPASQRAAALALLVGGLLLGCIFAVFNWRYQAKGGHPSTLSLILPALAVFAILALSAIVWSYGLRVRRDSGVSVEERVLGLPFRTLAHARGQVIRAWPVSPDGGTPVHVLIQTTAGPIAFACPPDRAEAVAASLVAGR